MTQPAAVPDHERLALHAALNRISVLPDEDFQALKPLHRQCWPKGSLPLKAGELAHQAAFVLSGALREYYLLQDGAERTRSFNLPGDLAGSLSDLLGQTPSLTWVAAETDSVLLAIDWSAYQQLVNTRPAWARFSGKLAESLYLRKVEREYELLGLNALERYQRTLLRWPSLESRFSQRDIASYIGITPVHLSRLRALILKQSHPV